jgi:hypothetical protein
VVLEAGKRFDAAPISYDDLRSHYGKVEREFGVAEESRRSATH